MADEVQAETSEQTALAVPPQRADHSWGLTVAMTVGGVLLLGILLTILPFAALVVSQNAAERSKPYISETKSLLTQLHYRQLGTVVKEGEFEGQGATVGGTRATTWKDVTYSSFDVTKFRALAEAKGGSCYVTQGQLSCDGISIKGSEDQYGYATATTTKSGRTVVDFSVL